MPANTIINVKLFGEEIGRIGRDAHAQQSSFQYNPDYLEQSNLTQIFPKTGIIRRTQYVQLFRQFDSETFKGIPPQFADSLPDVFGSIIFKAWLSNRDQSSISVLEQLAYVGKRGMGALEYSPIKQLSDNTTIDLDETIDVLKSVLDLKQTTQQKDLGHQSLLNIFKIGTSAGGARPKILISEHKQEGTIIPGDLEVSDDYHHYLVKLDLGDDANYPRQIIEYCYYQTLKKLGIQMMESKLIEDKHFATLRYDRQHGEKQHVLTATGMTGWDYKDPVMSTYENLFNLCSYLKLSHAEIQELYKRMVFNVIYGNSDDHLKNHSFIYDREQDRWRLSPVYDVTYALNPLLNIKSPNRALSLNGKRNSITLEDVLSIADAYTIKDPKGIIREVQSQRDGLIATLAEHDVPPVVIEAMSETIVPLV